MKSIQNLNLNGFFVLCYHYIRTPESKTQFPKILGNTINDFKNHLDFLTQNYKPISLGDVRNFYNGKISFSKNPHMLLTFDDGLSDHFEAAKLLHKYNIKGIFFIPTCILEDNLPPNPTIIHYSIAIYGIQKFLDVYVEALNYFNMNKNQNKISYSPKIDDPLNTINKIKSFFKYSLNYKNSRNVLLYIYKNLLKKNQDHVLEKMHLTKIQVQKMIEMGHDIGVHTHSHVSVAATFLNPQDFEYEVIHPKRYLKETFKIPINTLSYPFGGKKDCLSAANLIHKTHEYDFAFTVEPTFNTIKTKPLELGRHQPHSQEDVSKLEQNVAKILQTARMS